MAAGPIAFTVSGVLLVAILGGTLYAASLRADDPNQHTGDKGNAAKAQVLADALTGPGLSGTDGWVGPAWKGLGGDESVGLPGLGLVEAGGAVPGALDPVKLANLGQAAWDAGPGSVLDYEEAQAALGLGDLDFRLRMRPTLPQYVPGAPPTTPDMVASAAILAHSCAAPGVAAEEALVGSFVTAMGPCVECPVMPGTVTLPSVDVLWIPQGADHDDLLACLFPGDLDGFVKSGGMLVVMGSLTADDALLATVPPGPAASASPAWLDEESGLPLVTAPNTLADATYEAFGPDPVPASDATRYLAAAHDGATPTLLLSEPGSQGAGLVAVARVQLDDLDGDAVADPDESSRLVQNLLAQRHRHLFLDYGASRPPDAETIPAERVVFVPAPAPIDQSATVAGRCGSAGDCVQVRLYVFVF